MALTTLSGTLLSERLGGFSLSLSGCFLTGNALIFGSFQPCRLGKHSLTTGDTLKARTLVALLAGIDAVLYQNPRAFKICLEEFMVDILLGPFPLDVVADHALGVFFTDVRHETDGPRPCFVKFVTWCFHSCNKSRLVITVYTPHIGTNQ